LLDHERAWVQRSLALVDYVSKASTSQEEVPPRQNSSKEVAFLGGRVGCEGTSAVERRQSVGEEIANAVSHGVGLVAALGGAPVLIAHAARRAGAAATVGASVFAGTMVLLYLASTLYHALPRSGAKRLFQVIEHSAIFLLIAGTYTPFTLGVLRGTWGWTLFGLVWGLAVAGVVLKAVGGVRYPILSTSVYVAMGWLVVIAIRPLWLRVPMVGLIWLVLGGIAYTAGVPFFAAKQMPFGHFVWHLFVLAGTACHFFAVLWYAT
jgi:hemolysin III